MGPTKKKIQSDVQRMKAYVDAIAGVHIPLLNDAALNAFMEGIQKEMNELMRKVINEYSKR